MAGDRVTPKLSSYLLKGTSAGFVLGLLAYLAIARNAGGTLSFAGGEHTGFAAAAILIVLCVIIGLVVAMAAFVALKALTGETGN
jgi:hypothetical protein